MKFCLIVFALAFGHAHGSVSYGPSNCISLSKSSAGSCVITTDCEGQDLSKVEFAFNCNTGNKVERHSFGVGGFDESEEYDTEVKCDTCVAPTTPKKVEPAQSKVAMVKTTPHTKASDHQQRSNKTKVAALLQQTASGGKSNSKFWPFTSSEPEGVVKFGPEKCVSTYKSKEGHCMMKTDCKEEDVENYDFGLICVDKVGRPTRHLFGKGSFDVQETFDTLIECEQCLGLEDLPNHIAVNGQVSVLTNEIRELKDMMKNVSADVQLLNQEVFKGKKPIELTPVAAPAAAAIASPASQAEEKKEAEEKEEEEKKAEEQEKEEQEKEEAEKKEESALQAQAQVQSRHKQRKHRHRHLRRREDEDRERQDDEDEDEFQSRSHRRHRRHHSHHEDDSDDEQSASDDDNADNEARDEDRARDDEDDRREETRSDEEVDNTENGPNTDDNQDKKKEHEQQSEDDAEVGDGFND